MRIDVLRYLQRGITPTLYRRAVADRTPSAANRTGSPSGKRDEQPNLGSNGASKIKLDNFEKKYSPRRLLLVLAACVLMCGLAMKYVFRLFPNLHTTDMPLIGSVLLIVLLSPVLYTFFYRPMVKQYNKLRKAEAMMREFALIDDLTGLSNRRGFLTHADQLLRLSNRNQRGLILIYADLDNMKWINDEFGHAEGDRALVTAGEVLKKTFRNSDVVGRVGGDEFAILALEAKAESLDVLRKRLKQNLEKTEYNLDSVHKLTFSLGIIYYNPEQPQTIEELLTRADALMYKDKTFRSMNGLKGLFSVTV